MKSIVSKCYHKLRMEVGLYKNYLQNKSKYKKKILTQFILFIDLVQYVV